MNEVNETVENQPELKDGFTKLWEYLTNLMDIREDAHVEGTRVLNM